MHSGTLPQTSLDCPLGRQALIPLSSLRAGTGPHPGVPEPPSARSSDHRALGASDSLPHLAAHPSMAVPCRVRMPSPTNQPPPLGPSREAWRAGLSPGSRCQGCLPSLGAASSVRDPAAPLPPPAEAESPSASDLTTLQELRQDSSLADGEKPGSNFQSEECP